MVKSTALLQAYRSSHYRMDLPEQNCLLQIDQHSTALDAFLTEHACRHAIFITAHNPHSTPLPSAINHSRQAALEQVLLGRRLRYFPGAGYSTDRDACWPVEPGYLVLHTSPEFALSLARLFAQNAVLELTPGHPVALRWCDTTQ